jgi:sporulation protein YlmC with PRC-barrel domain
MEEITLKNALLNSIKASDLIGKGVLTAEGKLIGKVGEILISPKDFCLSGIVVKRGLIATDLFISQNYIKNFNIGGVELLVAPLVETVDIKVFDVNGKQIGKVKSIKRIDDSNKILSIVIDQGSK